MFTNLLNGGENFLGFVHPGSAMFNRQTAGNFLRRSWGAGEVPTSNLVGTLSVWLRFGEIAGLSIDRAILSGGTGTNRSQIIIKTDYRLEFAHLDGTTTDQLVTTRVFRDPTAYGHLVVNWDTDEVTDTDRIYMYWNGEQIINFDITNWPGAGKAFDFARQSNNTDVGSLVGGNPWEGFLAGYHYIDGTRYGPEEFGQFNPVHGEWIPKKASGLTYGNNGFNLDFADDTDLGNDVSGNANDFTAQGTFGSANSFIDVPANTFAMFNMVDASGGADISRAGLRIGEASITASHIMGGQLYPKTGKWYWEVTKVNTLDSSVGVATDPEYESARTSILPGLNIYGAMYRSNGELNEELATTGSWGATYTTNDVIGIAYDADTKEIWFSKNNVWQGAGSPDPAAGTDPATTIGTAGHPFPVDTGVVPCIYNDGAGNDGFDINFGQERGGFTYTPPTGFKALSTQNYPIPTGPAFDPSKFFDIIQYEGDGAASRTLTGLKFQPDMVWVRNLDAISDFMCAANMTGFSPSPTTPNNLRVNTSGIPIDNSTGNIEGFNSDGFDVADGATSGRDVNQNANTYAAWCWKSDPAAGFEIVRFQGTGVNRTVPHNLGVVPELMIVKNLDTAGNWQVYHLNYGRVTDPETDFISLDSNIAPSDNATVWNDTAPTSSVFTVGTAASVNNSGDEMVALVFASVPGFLKIQSQEGNGNANGAVVPTDFLPLTGYFRNWSGASNQNLMARNMDPTVAGGDGKNQDDRVLDIRDTATLGTYGQRDLLANGWKQRGTNIGLNQSGGYHCGFIYAQSAWPARRAR